MEDRTMRKMMMAVMCTAACGSITMMPNGNQGSGSDTGSDTGSDAGSDAGSGSDVSTAGITIDKTGFVDDGTRWWTNKSNPTLHGTIDNPNGDTLTVSVNTTTIGIATITGSTWSIDLPTAAISEADTAVVITRSSGGERRQLFALDDKAPVAMISGSIKDERGDTIDFSTGDAIHTHAGSAITLDGTGCPAVYKYAYLMDAAKPLYGSETSPNPFTWHIKPSYSTPLDGMDTAYRVRDASGTVLYDWTSMQPDSSGGFSITLHRNDIAALGTKTGHMFVDVRLHDAFGNESTTSACWDNHPMAAPLEVVAPAPGPIFGWTLAADSPISTLVNPGTHGVLLSQEIVQHTAEPITVAVGIPALAIPYTHRDVDDVVAEPPVAASIDCTIDPALCDGTVPSDPPDRNTAGTMTLSASNSTISLIDESTNQWVCGDLGPMIPSGCTIPARAANAGPRRYRLEVTLYDARELMPFPDKQDQFENYGEYALLGMTYTGLPSKPSVTVCSHVTLRSCTQLTKYDEFWALDTLTLQVPATTVSLQTAVNASTALAPPPNVAASQLTMAARTWNAGNDDLPGPQ